MLRGGGAVPWENINYRASFPPVHPPIFGISQEKQERREHSRSARARIRSTALLGTYFGSCAVTETRLGQINANTAAHFPGESNRTAGRRRGDTRGFRKSLNLLTKLWLNANRNVLYPRTARTSVPPQIYASARLFLNHTIPPLNLCQHSGSHK